MGQVLDKKLQLMGRMHKISLILIFTLIITTTAAVTVSAEDGTILKRAPEEICHSCHKTDSNARTDANSIKMHSAEWLGTCSNPTYKNKTDCITNVGPGAWTTKWGAAGWGITGGQYGVFLCTTCHAAHETKNIYLIKESINSPNSPTHDFPGGTVDFRTKTGTAGVTAGTMGDDSVAHNPSTRVCEVCHSQNKYHNSDSALNTDNTHFNAQDCSSCHSHKLAFKGSCDACHYSPPLTGKHAIHFGNATATYGTTTIQSTAGSYGYSCGICHYGTHLNTAVNPRTVEVIFSGVATQDPKSPSPGLPTYTLAGFSVDDPGNGWTFNYSAGTCSNIYCHGNYPGSGLNASPTFGDSSTAACGSCHGASNTTHPASGNHEKHVTATNMIGASAKWVFNREYACTICHKDIVAGTGPSNYTIADKGKHLSGNVDWKFDTSDPRVSASSVYGIASGTAVPSDGTTPRAYNTCNNVYCHSIVQTATGGPLTLNDPAHYRTPTWGTTHLCNGCHAEIGGHGGGVLASGSHAKHFTYTFNIGGQARKCTICHKWDPAAAFNSCGQCHMSAQEKLLHVNGSVDVLFDSYFGATATWNGTPAPGDGFATSTCSNVYCHSQGTSSTAPFNPNISPYTWGGTLDATCTGCHSGNAAAAAKMATNVHGQHINDTANAVGRNIGCTECHNATVSADRTISSTAYHVNKLINVKFNNAGGINRDTDAPTYDGSSTTAGAGATKAPGSAAGSCSNVYCHSIGNLSGTTLVPAGGAGFRTIAWNAAAINCSGCHGESATSRAHPVYASGASGSTTANSHVKHVETNTYGCYLCHLTTTTDAALPPTTVISGGTHINRVENVSFTTIGGASGTYTAGKACQSTYCHGAGNPVWGNNGSTTCSSCHQSQGAGGAVSYAPKHQTHVETAGYGFSCEFCHAVASTMHSGGPAAGTNPGGDAVGPNQTTEIRFTALSSGAWTTGAVYRGSASAYKYRSMMTDPYTGLAISPTYSNTGVSFATDTNNANIFYNTNGTCSNIWCHSKANPWGGTNAYASPNWNSALDCGSCHNKAGDGSPTWSAPHTKHINTYSANANMNCNACHANTASNNTTISNKANHVNAAKNIAWNAFANNAAPAYNLGAHQCSNIYCHGNGTTLTPTVGPITWTGTYSTCAECHGNAASIATGSHTKHLTSGATCRSCHNATASNNTTISNYANHVNKLVSLNFDASSAIAAATYNGQNAGGANVYQKTVATAFGSCNSIICHSDGTSVYTGGTGTGNTTAWGTAGTCYNCHGNQVAYADYRRAAPLYASGTPKPNAHQLHIRANGSTATDPSCANCHSATTTTNTTITGAVHANSLYNVAAGAPVYRLGSDVSTTGAVTVTYLFKDGGAGPSSCSNVSCHPTGITANKTVWSTAYNCTDCHNINLRNTSGYHHVMNTTAGGYDTYPTAVPDGDATNTASRRCTMCHVDHNIFSPMLNTSSSGRSFNLRTAIGTTPASGSGYTNSDYIAGGTGICISCHSAARTKSTANIKTETSSTVTPVISGAAYNVSAHQYNAATTMKNGTAAFNSNCSKCHNAKNGEGATTFQNVIDASRPRQFGTHDSTAKRLVAALGAPTGAGALEFKEDYEEGFCYRCHSYQADAIGGTKKPAVNNDWYGAVTNMTTASQDIYAAFNLGITGAPGTSTSTTDTLYMKPSAQETVSGVAPTDHYGTSQTTNTIYLKRAADDSTLGSAYPNAYFINSGTYNATTYWRRVMTPVSGGANENTAYNSSATANQYQRHAQFISLPLASNWTINNGQSFTLNIEDYEGNNASNGYTRYNVRRYTGAAGGTIVNTAAACQSGTEMGNNVSAAYFMQTITCTNNTGGNITFNAGDYIVLEVETINTTTTTSSFREQWGNNNARLTLPSNATFNTEPFAGGTANILSMSPFAPTAADETIGTATDTVGTNSSAANPVTQRWKKAVFVSPPVATATTTTAAAWTINIYDNESSANANARVRYMIYTWTAGGVFGSTIVPRTTYGTEMGTATALQTITTAAGSAVALGVGDKIVVDLEIETNAVTTGGNYNLRYIFGQTNQSNVVMPNNITFTYASPGTPPSRAHGVSFYSGLHRPSPTDETRAYIASNKHVECNDCHNPHAARAGTHIGYSTTASSTLYLRNTAAINTVPPTKPSAYQYSSGTYTTNTFTQRDMAPASGTTTASTSISTGNTAARYNRGLQFVSPQIDNTVTIASGSTFTLTIRESRAAGTSTDYTRLTVYKWDGTTATPFNTSAAPNNFGQNAAAISTTATNRSTTFTTNQAVTLNPGDSIVCDVEFYHSAGTTTLNVTYAYGNFGTDAAALALPAGTYNWRTGTASVFAPVLAGVSGVGVTTWNATNWGGVTTYNPSTTTAALITATAEWQICFKCHSSANANVLTWGGSGAAAFTDLGLEFNPNNRSGHPVVTSLNNYPNSPAPKALEAAQMLSPWLDVGIQTMTCSDCHSTSSTASKGPHGSSVKWMLAGTAKAWPYNNAANNGSSSGTPWRLSDIQNNTNNWDTNLFCVNCHPIKSGATWQNVAHSEHDTRNNNFCTACHIRVPHGGKVSRLIATTNMPARYYPNGDGTGTMQMTRFVKTTRNAYQSGGQHCGATACRGGHDNTTGEQW